MTKTRILHTADWHIGQMFLGYDRVYEHQQFLDWLITVIAGEEIDLLLISGDVFDQTNPSAASVRQFYSFLNNATHTRPTLQIIITAGNHDSASRLESPVPLLESSRIHIVGVIERTTDGEIDYSKLLIPITSPDGSIEMWCIAIPFLRMGDYPVVPGSASPYTEGVTQFYQEAYACARARALPGQAIIAMGHLHTLDAEISPDDTADRPIMGGVEFIPSAAFDTDLSYVALGHIHKEQAIGKRKNVRYSGSPIPLSFSEIEYVHQVTLIDMVDGKVTDISSLEVPVTAPLLRVPAIHSSMDEVMTALIQLPAANDINTAPYLEVCVLLDGPEPSLRHKIETAITGRNVRLARIDVRYDVPEDNAKEVAVSQNLEQLKPADVFTRIYETKYNNSVPNELTRLFNRVYEEAGSKEETA